MAAALETILNLLVKEGLLTRGKADECLRTHSEAAGKGERSSMTDIVVSKGVDPARLSLTLLTLKSVSLRCGKCRKRHKAKNITLDAVYACKRCGGPLEAEDVVPSGSGPIRKMEDPSPPEVIEARQDPKRVFGKYVLLRELGRGGYAIVYQAWDTMLAQHVALKLIRGEEDGLTEAPKAGEAEILREARLAARLQHPNIVRVWEVGTQGDRHFLSMEYIEGKSLARTLKGEGKGTRMPRFYSDVKRLLVILRDVARALDHAHSQRPPVVHRDVKPQNVLVDTKGRACLVDFGLAREVRPGAGRLTITGITKGTPCYMAPEQALGHHAEIDAKTDVWALGAMLYEYLAGRPPFDGPTERDILNQVVHEEPKRPYDVLRAEGLSARPFTDLEKICFKALDKVRSRRYTTAAEFATEIERFLTGQTVQAKVASGMARMARWIAKRKALSAAIAAAVVMAGVALGSLLRPNGPPKVVTRVIIEKDPAARLSAAAREIERVAADFQYDLAIRRYQDLIDLEKDPLDRSLLIQRLEDLRLQQAVLQGVVQRIQKEPRDYAKFRMKAGLPESARVIDASIERVVLRRRSEDEDVPWGKLDPRQYAELVKDYWPQIEGRAALGFGVWCLRHGLIDEAASLFKQRQAEPQAQRYLEELAVRSKAPDPGSETPRDRILRQAEDALGKGDYVIARARFERVLMLKPDDPDAASGLQRVAELERAREAEKPVPSPTPGPKPAPAPVPATVDPDPPPSPESTPEQRRAFASMHSSFISALRSRDLKSAANLWLRDVKNPDEVSALFTPALNQIVSGRPAAPEVRKALHETEKMLAQAADAGDLELRVKFDMRDLLAVSLIYGEVDPAVERVIQAHEVIELQSMPGGQTKLGTLERLRGTLNFSETIVSGGQKATIGWPVNLWGGSGTRLGAADLVAFVRRERSKRAMIADWRAALGEGLLLLHEGATPSPAESPEFREALRLIPEADLSRLKMPDYIRLYGSTGSVASRPAPRPDPPAEATADLLASTLTKNAARDYKGALEDVNRALAQKGSDPLGYYYRGIVKLNMRDLAGAVADCDRAIELSKSQPQLVPWILCARARAKDIQEDLEGAFADYSLAIDGKPPFSEPWRGRAQVYYQKRDYPKALADYSKAIQVEPNHGDDRLLRSFLYFDTGQWAKAAEDIRAGLQLRTWNDDAAHLYLWMSRVRLGDRAQATSDLRARLSTRAEAKGNDGWCVKIGGFFCGDLSEDALFQAAQNVGDRSAKEHLCEAYFYAGEKRLADGDRAGGESLFRKSLETGYRTFIEYLGAQAELDGMAGRRPTLPAVAGEPEPKLPPPPPAVSDGVEKLVAAIPVEAGVTNRLLSVSPDGAVAAWVEIRKSVANPVPFRERVIVGGKKGPEFDSVGAAALWMKGNVLVYKGRMGEKTQVVVGERRHDAFDEVSGLVVSPDGRHVAYLANVVASGKSLAKQVIVIDGSKREYPHASAPTFKPDSNVVAYQANLQDPVRTERPVLVIGTTVTETADFESSPVFSANGRIMAWIGPSPRTGESEHMLFTSNEGMSLSKSYFSASRPSLSANGKTWAMVAGSKDDPGEFVVSSIGPGEGAKFEQCLAPVLSADGASMAYVAVRRDGTSRKTFVVRDQETSPEYDWTPVPEELPQPVFSPNGKSIAYRASINGRPVLVIGKSRREGYAWVGAPAWSSDGKTVSFAAARGSDIVLRTVPAE